MRSPLRTSRGGRSRCHSTLHAVIVQAVPTGQVASRWMWALGKGQRLPEQVVDAQGHVAAPDASWGTRKGTTTAALKGFG